MRSNNGSFFCPPFRPMVELVPEMREGDFRIIHHTLTKEDVELAQIRSIMSYSGGETGYLQAATYVELRQYWTNDKYPDVEHNNLLMSDTPMERRTNSDLLRAAKGDVLIAGLGFGMVLWPLLHKEEVTSITVIELHPEIIKMIEPIFAPLADECSVKLDIVCDSIFDWKIPKGAMWDTIYFDIWNDICGDNYEEMKTLHRRFSLKRPPGGWIGSWRKADVRKQMTGVWRDDYEEGFRKIKEEA